MTLDQIHEEINERARAERAARRHNVTVTLIVLGVVATLVLLLALAV